MLAEEIGNLKSAIVQESEALAPRRKVGEMPLE